MSDQQPEHWHSLAPLVNTAEGWTFMSGVPDGAEDGYFIQDVASFGPVDDDRDTKGGLLGITAVDGVADLHYDQGVTFSLAQVRQFRELLDQALPVLAAYQPPAWMLDPEQLHQRKVEAAEEIHRLAVAGCAICEADDPGSDTTSG